MSSLGDTYLYNVLHFENGSDHINNYLLTVPLFDHLANDHVSAFHHLVSVLINFFTFFIFSSETTAPIEAKIVSKSHTLHSRWPPLLKTHV